ncbi:uncharacterized protein PAC_02473 [Phialocephala subalpina]|uniref:Uncharacterized protein n=1 Tax=Phialocephala subalpina TaxID=576137 RepID=A0A1L7WIL1_9HELO|nr:uncharacterized protein PAC_02473 [Phialocephala subalpina]
MGQSSDDQNSTISLPTLNDGQPTRSLQSQSRDSQIELPILRKPLQLKSPVESSINIDTERAPLIDSASLGETPPLPPKQFEHPRQVTIPFSHLLGRKIRVHPYRTLHTVLILTLVILPVALVGHLMYPQIQSGGNLPYHDCTYTGKVTFQGIDLPYGKMTFAQAKAIDLAWNTLVGRSLQTVISIFTYKVFMKALMRIAERNTLTYEVYAALAVSTTRLSAIWPLTKALNSKLNWQARFSITWLLLSTVYLAALPTLIDASSGYQAAQLTNLKLPNDSRIDLTLGNYVSRIDLTPGNYVSETGVGHDYWFSAYKFIGWHSHITDSLPRPRPSLTSTNNLSMDWVVPLANQTYFTAGVLVDYNELYFGDPIVATPLSNISYFAYPLCLNTTHSQLSYMVVYNVTDYYSQNSQTEDFYPQTYSIPQTEPLWNIIYNDSSCKNWYPMFKPQNITNDTLPSQINTQYNESYFLDPKNYECVSTDIYQWVRRILIPLLPLLPLASPSLTPTIPRPLTSSSQGFSYAWLLITCTIHSIWLLGTYILSLDSSYNSEIIKKGRKYGTWRAILDLAESVNRDLGRDTCAYGEDEIVEELGKRRPVGYFVDEQDGGGGVAHLALRGEADCARRRRVRLYWGQFYGRKND